VLRVFEKKKGQTAADWKHLSAEEGVIRVRTPTQINLEPRHKASEEKNNATFQFFQFSENALRFRTNKLTGALNC